MKETLLNPWNYDKILALKSAEMEKTKERLSEAKLTSESETRPIGPCTANAISNLAQGLLAEERLASGLSMVMNMYAQPYTAALEEQLASFKRAKPFWIGPATLDSLVNQVPYSKEYIIEGKLPFNEMFFEFFDPITLGFPFSENQEKVLGVYLEKTIPDKDVFNESLGYRTEVFYQVNKDIVSLDMVFTAESQKFLGTVGGNMFVIDQRLREFESLEVNHAREKLLRVLSSGAQPQDRDIWQKLPLEKIKNKETFIQISNLCTNLVNYINSHNVTIVRKDRELDVLRRNERNKKKKVTLQKPYYIVQIRDVVIPDRNVASGQTWELPWRVYVRGHDRKYRNEDGAIYLKLWIEPFIKGPDDAPWRHQRYEVLAKKLLQEKEMYKKMLDLE